MLEMSAMSDSIQKRPAPFVPAAELRISDLETVRVIAEPLRFRLIQTMSTRPEEPWTVKGIASLHGSTEDAEGGREAVLLSHSLDRLSTADAAEFRTRLRALANEFGQRLERDEGGSANRAEKSTTPQETRPYGFVVAFYPMVDVRAPKARRSRRSSSPSTGDTR